MNITSPNQAFALLNKTDPLQTAEVIENHITVTHLPDLMAAIQADQNPALDMKVLIKPGGFIQLTSPGVITGNIVLPNPNLIGKRTPEGTLGIRHIIQGAVMLRISKLVCDLHGLDYSPQTHWSAWSAITQWTKCMPLETARRIRANTRYTEMENAVRQLLNTQAWESAQNAAGKVHVKRYNRTIAGALAIHQLTGTNPGAASWIISQNRAPTGALNHPGEVVRQVQDRAQKAGVEPRYWKTVSRMDPGCMELLLQRHIPQYAAGIIINACGDVQCSPNKTQVNNALTIFGLSRSKSDHITQPRLNEPPINSRARQRLRHLLRLIVKPGGPENNLTNDWVPTNYLVDYVANLMDNDQDVTAQTYKGLLKAARRWHQAEQQELAAAKVQEQIDRQDGWFPCWNSLLDTITMPDPCDPAMPDITIVPLTSTPDLLAEGKHMRHCVATFTSQCSRGSSRIFSVRQDNTTIATTELVLRSGRWQPAQTRAWKNQEPPDAAHHAAQALAQAYQQRWKETGKPRHHNWVQHPQTGETKRHLNAHTT